MILKKPEKDEGGKFYRCPNKECWMYFDEDMMDNGLIERHDNWMKLVEVFKNQSIARWLT